MSKNDNPPKKKRFIPVAAILRIKRIREMRLAKLAAAKKEQGDNGKAQA